MLMDKDSIAQWIRVLNRNLENMGIERKDRRLTDQRGPSSAQSPAERKEIYAMWMRDSLLWAYEELATDDGSERGGPLTAFRGLVQAHGYAAHSDHDCVTSDAYTALRNHIEALLRAPRSMGKPGRMTDDFGQDWFINSGAVAVDSITKRIMVAECIKTLERDADQGRKTTFSTTGDTMIVVLRTRDGYDVYDCLPRRSTLGGYKRTT
jgi:hypothetical protein